MKPLEYFAKQNPFFCLDLENFVSPLIKASVMSEAVRERERAKARGYFDKKV